MKQPSTALREVTSENKVKALLHRIGKRNLIIACSVLLIGAAVWLNWMLFSPPSTSDGYGGYDQPSGNISGNNGGNAGSTDADDTYFSATLVNRQKARDEALEVLQSVVDNEDAGEELKNEALASISMIAEEIRKEAAIETLVTAKGFEQCVAVLNGDTACIVVKAEDLQVAQIAQINAIVYEQTGISPSGITIIQK
ncbi:MAG: SpoIIIAH-like family protein [Clostridia bacterium]|nr:SpoIIIAH-like family protein [Clostridia bacterium]MBQ1963446.1 SpoIIIAH-like family protein [Clostridia bacterium]MBQ5833579.1 SpoIIIAH-like family protein [Clostridia bacterium]